MKKLNKNQSGFGAIEAVLILVIVGLIGFVGWYVWQNKATPTNTTTTTTTPTKTTTPSKTADSNTGYLVMKEWNLQFKVPSDLTHVKYAINGDTAAIFAKPTGSSVEYRSDYNKFTNGNFEYATGVLYRSTNSTDGASRGDMTVEGKKIGNYYYYTAWSFSGLATGAACVGLYGDSNEGNCEPEGDAFQLVNQGDQALLKTIELVQ